MKNTVNNKEKKEKRFGEHDTELIVCIIVGGGAAGMAAAISAREHGAESVLLLEKNDCLGKKLKQTGICKNPVFAQNQRILLLPF